MKASIRVVDESSRLNNGKHAPSHVESISFRTSTTATARPLAPSSKIRLLSHTDIVNRIIQGQHLVIYHSLVLDLTRWADKHPGGKAAILHFVGRDASDEMDAYHSVQDLNKAKGFVVGRVQHDVVSV